MFYGEANGNGHVAVSIGNGQEIGTYEALPGQTYPIRQYPVTGFLSNPYLGWAEPLWKLTPRHGKRRPVTRSCPLLPLAISTPFRESRCQRAIGLCSLQESSFGAAVVRHRRQLLRGSDCSTTYLQSQIYVTQ